MSLSFAFFDSTIPLDFVFELGTLPSLYRDTQNYSYQNVTTESDGSDELDGDVSSSNDTQDSGEADSPFKTDSIFRDDKKMETKGVRRTTQCGPKYIHLYAVASFNLLTITTVEKTSSIS